jgi:hypothetical protein
MSREYVKPMKCGEHMGDFICSENVLPAVIKSLMGSGLLIKKVMLCNRGGYHIWVKKK